MAQTPHPLDREIEEMYETHQALVRIFSRDGVIDADERFVLERNSGHKANIGGYRLREEFADSYKRNGLSRVTNDRAKDAGLNVTPLHREPANVVKFPTRRPTG